MLTVHLTVWLCCSGNCVQFMITANRVKPTVGSSMGEAIKSSLIWKSMLDLVKNHKDPVIRAVLELLCGVCCDEQLCCRFCTILPQRLS